MKQLENILTRNNINFLKTDNQDLNILRDDRWVEMFNELGYERGNIYFINNNGPFFIVFPDNMIGTATNVMLPDAINCLEEELELNLQIPSNFGKIYTDESDDDCAIIIFNINELESLLNQNINESKNLKNTIRLTESELHNIIKESVKKLLRKSSITNENYHFSDYYNDFDSNDIRQEYPRGKQGDIKYSWDKDKYDEKHSLINKEMKDLANSSYDYRDLNNYWSDRELKQGKKNMNKWVRGEYKNSNQIDDELNNF